MSPSKYRMENTQAVMRVYTDCSTQERLERYAQACGQAAREYAARQADRAAPEAQASMRSES